MMNITGAYSPKKLYDKLTTDADTMHQIGAAYIHISMVIAHVQKSHKLIYEIIYKRWSVWLHLILTINWVGILKWKVWFLRLNVFKPNSDFIVCQTDDDDDDDDNNNIIHL